MSRSALFLQVRMGSSRLPGKALFPLGAGTVLSCTLDALAAVPCTVRAVLTDSASAPRLEKTVREAGFDLFTGPEEDVLARYVQAARHYGSPEMIVRATGDNPLVSSLIAEKTMDLFRASGADYAGYLGIPLGTGVEVLRTEALYQADALAREPYEREHVSPLLYNRPDLFTARREWIDDPSMEGSGRVTLDTPEDYRYIDSLFKKIYRGKPIGIRELVTWLSEQERFIS